MVTERASTIPEPGLLHRRGSINPIALDKPPPLPLPENLWGDRWRFAALPAGNIEEAFAERPIPILQMPEFLLPINLGLASTVLCLE
jgi:hypothetical protein